MFDFDQVANRTNTDSLKWDVLPDELPMWVADMDFDTAPCIKNAISKRLTAGALGYSLVPQAYFDAYSKWWQRRHNLELKTEWMIFTTGVVPAISSIVRKLTKVGDNIVVLAPVYNIFYNSIINNDRVVLSSNLVYQDRQYHIDFDDLETKLANSSTTMLIFCNPHNPIGRIWQEAEIKKVAELCQKYNVLVLSDEIHCDIVEPDKSYVPFLSAGQACQDLTVVCLSSSKAFNLAGLQSACVVVPNADLRKKVDRGLNTDEVAEPNAFACGATIAAFEEGESWLKDLNNYICLNKQTFTSLLDEYLPNLKVVKGEATYMLWVDCSYYCEDTFELCAFLRKETGLYISSGKTYGDCGKAFFRINLATNTKRVIEAVKRLKKGIELFTEKHN